MTYQETARGLGLNGAMGTQRLRLEYTDRRHFRTTLGDNPSVPAAVGSTWSFAGDRSTFYDALHGVSRSTPYRPDEFTVPADWLVPGNTLFFAQRPGYAVTRLDNGVAALIRNEIIRTAPSAPGQPPLVVPPRTFRQQITYRESDGIPTGLVETVDGVVTRRIDLQDFRLTR